MVSKIVQACLNAREYYLSGAHAKFRELRKEPDVPELRINVHLLAFVREPTELSVQLFDEHLTYVCLFGKVGIVFCFLFFF